MLPQKLPHPYQADGANAIPNAMPSYDLLQEAKQTGQQRLKVIWKGMYSLPNCASIVRLLCGYCAVIVRDEYVTILSFLPSVQEGGDRGNAHAYSLHWGSQNGGYESLW